MIGIPCSLITAMYSGKSRKGILFHRFQRLPLKNTSYESPVSSRKCRSRATSDDNSEKINETSMIDASAISFSRQRLTNSLPLVFL
jgi:hypothetical protein